MEREIDFKSFDGTKLHFICDEVADTKAVVILVHGLCEYTGRYQYVTEQFCEKGYTVYRFDHRGHGKSEGKMTYFENHLEISDDLNEIVTYVLKENPGKKVFVVGHSMGGHAAAGFGTRFPGKVDGIVMLGAITRQNNSLTGEFPIELPDDVYLENEFSEGLCNDKEVLEAYMADPNVPKKISVGLLNRVWEGTLFLREYAEQFTDPVLVLHGARDGVVSEKDSRDFYGDIKSTDKTLKIYSRLCHELLNEPCKDEIIAEIIQWLDRHC